jgi:hypothetical protein
MEDVGIPILWPFVLFYSHLVYFIVIWYILCPFGAFILLLFGIFFPSWYEEKPAGTLLQTNIDFLALPSPWQTGGFLQDFQGGCNFQRMSTSINDGFILPYVLVILNRVTR